jgi:hypothetical protein
MCGLYTCQDHDLVSIHHPVSIAPKLDGIATTYDVVHQYLSILREQNIVVVVGEKSRVEKGSESMGNNVALVVEIWRLFCVFNRLLLNGE